MSKLAFLSALLGLTALAAGGFSAVNPVAGTANPMDNAGISARATGMGSAYVAVADDSSALSWNPAGLAGLAHPEIALHHNSWLAGIIQETFVGALPLGGLGTFAASINYVNYGSLPAYDDAGNAAGDYAANRYGFALGWGKELFQNLSAGLALKGSTRTIDESRYSDFSADLGALWLPMPGLKLGLSYSNLGTLVAGYSLASALRLGASYSLELSPSNRLLGALSGSFEPGGVSHLQVGVEDLINSCFSLRLGYQPSLADTRIQGLSGLSAGLGIELRRFSLDYAFLPFGDLGIAQRLSLAYKFQRAAEAL